MPSAPLTIDVLGIEEVKAYVEGLKAENARLRAALGTLCYEAHVVVKANSTLSMAGLAVKPSFVKLYEAKEAAQALLSEGDDT